MSNSSGMSDAAVAAGATPLSPDWEWSALRCTKAGLRGQPNVLELTRIVHHDGANFSKISPAECASRLASLVAAHGSADTSVFESMEEETAVAASVVGTASFKNAEGVRVLVSWALEALRPLFSAKSSRVYLPALVAQQQTPAEDLAAPVEQLAPANAASTTSPPAQQGRAVAVPAQQQQSVEEVAGPGKGAEAPSDAAAAEAAKRGARSSAQRSQAAEALQRKGTDKLVALVWSSGPEIPRELRLRLDPALEVMRDVDGVYTWNDLVVPLASAMRTAMDLNLWDARKTYIAYKDY